MPGCRSPAYGLLRTARNAAQGALARSVAGRLAPRRRHVVARHEVVDEAVKVGPRRLAEIVRPQCERRADVEFLVLQMAAGEFRPDQIPGELEQLDALERRH